MRQGPVFYVAGEGQQGIGRRIAAWLVAHGVKAESVPFFVAKTPTQLMNKDALKDVLEAIEALSKRYGEPALVHIDTLARNFGDGDENATKDMNRVISNLDRVFGNTFCRGLTHHTGHGNKDRARGSTALHGAADAAFRVSVTPDGRILSECKKMKDSAPAPTMLFEKREILLQIGDLTDHSFVLKMDCEGEEIVKTHSGPSAKMKQAFDVLKHISKGDFIDKKLWRNKVLEVGIYARSDSFNRADKQLELEGLTEVDENREKVRPICGRNV